MKKINILISVIIPLVISIIFSLNDKISGNFWPIIVITDLYLLLPLIPFAILGIPLIVQAEVPYPSLIGTIVSIILWTAINYLLISGVIKIYNKLKKK